MPFDLYKIYTDVVSWFAVFIIGGMLGWIVRLMRKINTNERQIAQDRAAHNAQMQLILAELENRGEQRSEDRERVKGLESDVRELRQDVRDIRNAVIGKK